MTAYTAIETMVRNAAATDLKNDASVIAMIEDMDRLEEIESGEERAEKRELLAQHIINHLVSMSYITEEHAFDLLNKSNPDFGHSEIKDIDFSESVDDTDDLEVDYDDGDNA